MNRKEATEGAECPLCAVLTALTCESFQTRASQLSAGTGSDLGDLSQGFRDSYPSSTHLPVGTVLARDGKVCHLDSSVRVIAL